MMLDQLPEVVTYLGHATIHASGEVLAAVPNPGSGEAPAFAESKVLTILKWIAWFASAACVAGILVVGAKMAISHRRGDDTNVAQLGWVLAGVILIGSASGIVGTLI